MTSDLQEQISTLQATIDTLERERAALAVRPVLPESEAPEAIVEAYRSHARATAQQAAELKGIDDAITALKDRLREKKLSSATIANTDATPFAKKSNGQKLKPNATPIASTRWRSNSPTKFAPSKRSPTISVPYIGNTKENPSSLDSSASPFPRCVPMAPCGESSTASFKDDEMMG